MTIQTLVDRLQQLVFSPDIRVTFGIATGVTGEVDGHTYTVHTRNLDDHSVVYDQLKNEVERDITALSTHYPEYKNYHIRIHSLCGNLLRYGKLAIK